MKLAKLEFLRHGSAKDIYKVDGQTIAFRFTDHFSVFDVGRAPFTIPAKGLAVCACAVKSFELAKEIGVPTHFVEQLDPITIRVKEAQIITGRFLTDKDENYLVPVELIYRLFVAGSIDRAFQAGEKKPEDYGLEAGIIPKVGTPFPYPVHMTTTKFEKTDRDITTQEVCQMAGITIKDLSDYWSMIDRLTGAIGLELSRVGFMLLDGKMECIMGPGRQKMIGDVFGTPDEDRPALIKNDKVIHFSKEYLRQHYIQMGYLNKLKVAHKAGKDDIPIPLLSKRNIQEVSQRYVAVAEAYSGKRLEV
jgi:phosphoribosylaminoimidazole-succinocarboxamide synthase